MSLQDHVDSLVKPAVKVVVKRRCSWFLLETEEAADKGEEDLAFS
jgi:hypothetical protein